MIPLALLRHGPTDWNRAGRIQGRTDRPLSDEARADLATMRLPAPWDAAQLQASPLIRTHQTAKALTGQMPAIAPALIEMHWGDWEGQRGVDLLADPGSGYRHIEDWGWDFRPPGGESPRDMLTRLKVWLAGLTTPTIAITHIGVMRVLLAAAHGWEFTGSAPFRIKRNRLFLLEVSGAELVPGGAPVRLEPRR